MFCSGCGANNETGAGFCFNCGRRINEPPPQPSPEERRRIVEHGELEAQTVQVSRLESPAASEPPAPPPEDERARDLAPEDAMPPAPVSPPPGPPPPLPTELPEPPPIPNVHYDPPPLGERPPLIMGPYTKPSSSAGWWLVGFSLLVLIAAVAFLFLG